MRIKLKTKKLFQANWSLTFLIAILCCFFTNLSYTFAQREKLIFEQLSVEQGLSFNGVTDIIKDKKGFMWFATANGLNRFDGYNFKVFKPDPNDTKSLPSPFVNNLYLDSNGLIWMNVVGNLCRYNETDGTFYRYLKGKWLTSICEDTSNSENRGMWFGTLGGGLYWWSRKDSTIKEIHHSSLDLNSLVCDSLLSMSIDRKGTLWIGTFRGLNSTDISRKNIKRYTNGPNIPVYDFCFEPSTNQEIVWIGTGKGLYKYDEKLNRFFLFKNQFASRGNPNDNDVRNLYIDSKGIIWVGMIGGIAGFDIKSEKYFTYYNKVQSYPWGYITKTWLIQEDNKGIVWAIAHGAGPSLNSLLKFDRKLNKFIPYPSLPGEKPLLAYSMYIDKLGTMWLGTPYNGIIKIDWNRKPFHNYLFRSEKNDETNISGITEDNAGNIWLGSNKGLIRFNPHNESFKFYKKNQLDYTGLSTNDIHTVVSDSAGNIWVSIDGIDVFDSGKNIFRHFKNDPADSNGLIPNITALFKSRDGTMWIGTYSGILEEYSYKTNSFKHHYPNFSGTFDHTWLSGLTEDKHGIIWFTVSGAGLISYNKFDNSFKRLDDTLKPSSKPILSKIALYTIYSDDKDNLWIGSDAGVLKYNQVSHEFEAITEQNGIENQFVDAILEDNKGYIWFGTVSGLSKYDPRSKRFWNFDSNDGLNFGLTRQTMSHKAKNGEFYFGGSNGFVRFYPDSIQLNPNIPPIVITAFRKFGKDVLLDSAITEKKQIELSYRDNVISFEFAALNYSGTQKNQYAYKLNGFDKAWTYCGTRRTATYTNLDGGTYTFWVKGSNNDGIWNEKGTSIAIIISPPWWETWWAYSSYAIIFVFSLYGIRRYELNRLRLKDKVKMDEAVLKEKEETDKMKSRFFANISHEFRTPLTLILGPAEKIISDTSENIKKDANIIKRNSRRLLQLINQLLDLSKLEAGKLNLEASKGNIVSFVKGAALSFESLAESKDISLRINSEKEFIEMYFDKEKMMKILTNILSNAFKFTPEEGEITVTITETSNSVISKESSTEKSFNPGYKISPFSRNDKTKGFVEIKIKDTGIGIAKEEIEKLFDRFYQVDSSHTREYEGTGIGLALTKELIELHQGYINVKSEKGVYTEFTLEFPLGKNHLKDEEVIEEKDNGETVILTPLQRGKNLPEVAFSGDKIKDSSSPPVAYPQNDNEMNEDRTIILIVEDNYDMRTYIKESFNSDYIIEEAINGEQGVRKAEKIIPDLIISDMMMPKMDGNELVRILKNDEKTSHIPIILLTARAGYEDKLEGLETGADEYLTKPFDIKELQIRVKNLINIRKKLHEKFSKIEFKPVKEKKLNSLDEKFMNRVNEIIEEHIAEEEFNMEEFGEELFMSRMQVYRKLKALTGKSANRYVRTFKLQKARKMIEEKQGTISEIAYSLGFGSPAYFTKCFKDEFGYPPRETVE
jgi:signal transduction histidine kinase/ligand-binding sensor domain-containing protein/DNA-binding response OmpR family regulator